MVNALIPAKPESVTWTDDQWKAIYAKEQDILVAAAAGSGKTAVLVERIIQKILSSEEPIDVDQLLVVTFTNASAAEMRHRIGEALEKAIDQNPKSAHLRKQLSLLNRAAISTLHSFCLEVIRKYYYLLDIDPGFRIANETEVQLLRDEVLDDLFEEAYGTKGNEAFFALVDTFTNDRSDAALQDMVRDLYDFAQSNPSPGQYLDSIVEMYNLDGSVPIENLPFAGALMYDIELQLEGAKQLLQQGLEIARRPEGPAPRAENFLEDLQIVDTLIMAKNESWQVLYNAMQSWSFSRAKTCRGDEFNKGLIETAQKLREKAKKILQDLQAELFSRKPESFIRDMKEMEPNVHTLVKLVKQFSARFAKLKQEKGIVDFSDLEHYCLAILTGEASSADKLMPSDAALSYRNRFKEVLIDEYQDVNLVQEAIIQLVSRDGEATGNLFMVGDVKQSIYRFRLAEPNLFLGKYNRFRSEGIDSGLRIDLAQNFRSRSEVLDATNFLFKQLMGVKVGEIDYNEAAELKKGAPYPMNPPLPVEIMLVENGSGVDSTTEETDEADPVDFDPAELEQSQLEARLMVKKVKELISSRQEVYNTKTNTGRPVVYRDIVILLRSMTWAPQIIEEFRQEGIPAYANLSSGYFEATEVAVMMSLLKVIDNPFQDIPLASVLRSPIVGLNEEDLAKIRIHHRNGTFYEALSVFCRQKPTPDTEAVYDAARPFFEQFSGWRSKARQGSLSELIWQLYRETRFYDFVGGMPGGKQRQANLRALYDRARQYESTSFRGLFRFLRFIERMRDRGDDLGAARALGEQEDVVRIMTIHSSKGLEFPIVFIAGLARKFNTMDLKKPYMLDKNFGFAAKYINAEKRISYPSLPQLAFKRNQKMEMLAEEMRVLYVALTRAKEKLYLIGSVKEAEKQIDKWTKKAASPGWLLKEYDRASASSYLDWIGASLVRHRDFERILLSQVPAEIAEHPSRWKFDVIKAGDLTGREEKEREEQEAFLKKVASAEPVPLSSLHSKLVTAKLSWQYAHQQAAAYRLKQSVSEMKRHREIADEQSGTDLLRRMRKPILNRPRFMQEKSLTPAERGTAMHMVMQHIDLSQPITEEAIKTQVSRMVQNELLSEDQQEAIEPEWIVQFFASKIGLRMLKAPVVNREIPFNLALPAREAYREWNGTEEPIFVQGVIDCMFQDEAGTVLLDYKTDRITGRFTGGFEEAKPILTARYELQLNLYTRALEQILKREINERYLFFFDGGHLLKMDKNEE